MGGVGRLRWAEAVCCYQDECYNAAIEDMCQAASGTSFPRSLLDLSFFGGVWWGIFCRMSWIIVDVRVSIQQSVASWTCTNEKIAMKSHETKCRFADLPGFEVQLPVCRPRQFLKVKTDDLRCKTAQVTVADSLRGVSSSYAANW